MMQTSRVAAAAAAVAIGFGVTLAGVAAGDDDEMITGVDADVEDEAAEFETDPDDEFDESSGEVGEGDEIDEESEVEREPDASTDGGGEATESTEPRNDPVDVDPESTEPEETELEATVPDSTVPASTAPETTVSDELDDVRCVPTISVVLVSGEQVDLVVEASEGATSWRVLDADGSFVISLDDQDVVEVVEVLRNVRFFQGAPVNFFGLCDEVGPANIDDVPTGESGGIGDEVDGEVESASVDFPCSDRALSQLRDWLLDDEIARLDDLGEVQLALAARLDGVGGRDIDEWFTQFEDELVRFRTFERGCPEELERGFTSDGMFCAVSRISADDGLFTYFEIVAPAVMSDCTYEPDENGEF